MALVVKDRVRETSTTTGTGTFTLAGAVTGYQAFSAVGDGNTTYYTIYLQGGNEWEVGIGTYTASGTTLSRDTVLASSSGGSKINFSAGVKDVFVTYPADWSVSQYDVGTGANQLPLNQYLGNLAYQDAGSIAGQVGLSAGTAALPSLVSATDTDTGMWFPAANTLAWSTGGTRAMTVDSSGNLLVGLTSSNLAAGRGLMINAPAGQETRLKMTNTTAGSGTFNGFDLIVGTSGDVSLVNWAATGMAFYTGGTTKVLITSLGGFETKPAATGHAVFNEDGVDADFRVEGDTDTHLIFADASTDRVGIGTNNPGFKLDVAALQAVFRLASTTGTNAVYMFTTNTGGDFYVGRDNSTGTTFGSNTAYTSVLWSAGAYPMAFFTNGTEKMRLDSSGNLGLGVTPSAWRSGDRAFDIGGISALADVQAAATRLVSNAYGVSGGVYIYKTNNFASYYNQQSGQHQWYTAPSGTANSAVVAGSTSYTVVALGTTTLAEWQAFFNDSSNNPLTVTPTLGQVLTGNATGTLLGGGLVTQNISFTQAMTLDALGNLGIGETNPGARLHVDSGSTGNYAIFKSTNANGGYAAFYSSSTVQGDIGTAAQIVSGGAATDFGVNARGSRNLIFGTNNTERARITSGGYFKASDNGTYTGISGTYHEFNQSANSGGLLVNATNASYSDIALIVYATRNTTNNSFYALSYYNTGAAAYKFRVADSGSISTAGSIQLGDAGAPPTSGVGVKFPATQSASSDANTLDDYEEGTWTPAVRGALTAGTYELATAEGSYVKIGKQVTLTCRVVFAAAITGGGTGYLQITGAPSFNNAAAAYGPVSQSGLDMTTNYTWLTATFISNSGTTILYLEENGDNVNSSDFPISGVSANDSIRFSITYIATA